jgi:hypothetical protein
MNDLTTSYFSIEKSDKQADGTLMVYGKATDDSVDIDQQICDAAWLDRAMPAWFKSGGNIREQHSSIAAGVAKEYESKEDGHYIMAHVVDPVSVKKVDAGVLRGFSIGIKSPRVVRDNKAANGRIVDGQIVEVSLVDRPANPNCQLVLAKSVEGQSSLVQVEEYIVKEKEEPNYEGINQGGKGYEPSDKELYNRVKSEAKNKFDVYPSAVANAWVVREYKKRGGTYKKEPKKDKAAVDYRKALQSALQLLSVNKSEETPMKDSVVKLPTKAVGDLLKFDKIQYEAAREALANLIAVEAGSMRDGHNELQSIAHLLEAVAHLHAWYEGEEAEGEVMEENESIELAAKAEGSAGCDCVGCTDCGKAGGCDKAMCGGHKSYKEAEADEEAEKSADLSKCLQCGCNQPGSDHGLKTTNDFANTAIPAIVTTAEMYAPGETPKSAEADEAPTEEAVVAETPAETAVEEAVTENSEAPTEVDAADVEAIVEQVVKSATESLRAEIASLVAAKEVALEKSVNLESELAIAKSLAVAGGPSRTTKPLSTKINDNLTKAAIYKAKANATTDPVLAKGYKQLAEEFYSKASDSDNN